MWSCFLSFILFIVVIVFLAGVVGGLNEAISEDLNKNKSKPLQSRRKSSQAAVRNKGRRKRYRINRYGEVFEE